MFVYLQCVQTTFITFGVFFSEKKVFKIVDQKTVNTSFSVPVSACKFIVIHKFLDWHIQVLFLDSTINQRQAINEFSTLYLWSFTRAYTTCVNFIVIVLERGWGPCMFLPCQAHLTVSLLINKDCLITTKNLLISSFITYYRFCATTCQEQKNVEANENVQEKFKTTCIKPVKGAKSIGTQN